MAYQRRWNGDEYYPRDKFNTDKYGKEVYARDRKNNEFYPKSKKNVFARDNSGMFYYAKDNMGNEFYPVRKNKSIFIQDSLNPNIKLALYADGTQRYPVDSKGNEYYLTENGKPYLMRRNNGEIYFAKNRKDCSLIPWNHIQHLCENEPLIYLRDSAGNLVYVRESSIYLRCQAYLKCPICDRWITSCL